MANENVTAAIDQMITDEVVTKSQGDDLKRRLEIQSRLYNAINLDNPTMNESDVILTSMLGAMAV